MSAVDEMVCFSLYSATRATTRAYSSLLEPWSLSYPQYLALVMLWTEGDQSVSEMGEALQLDSGTLSPLLRRLEDKGLIERRRSERDQRVVVVSPTDRASELREELAHIPEAIARAMGLPSLDAAHRLIQALHRLTEGMDEVRDSAHTYAAHEEGTR